MQEYNNQFDPLNGVAMNDEWAIPSLVTGSMGLFQGGKTALGIAPYLKDIWKGKDLLFHKPFGWMNKQELKQYGNLGKKYYQEHLQNNPVNIPDYGLVKFGRHNKGKDKTINMEQYPFLRQKLETSTKGQNTNSKNELDRSYDHFINTYKGNLYHYLIENINKDGARYKMMKNKSIGE